MLASVFTVNAGLMMQLDTNSLAVSSTNTFVLWGDVTGSFTNGQTPGTALFIDGTKSSSLYCSVGGFFTNSTATASNITFRIAASVDNVNWTNSNQVILLAVPGNTTNWVNYQFAISASYPIYGLRAIENTNAAAVTARASTLYFKAYSKNGL